MKSDYIEITGQDVSKVAIHKKFTKNAVLFLKRVLQELLSCNMPVVESVIPQGYFSCICIKDSSKFRLPLSYIKDYPGYGSFGKDAALMNLQFEYDLSQGDWHCIELTKATRNDQSDSKETVDSIRHKGLYMRDLGYVTMEYLQGVINHEAFFLNRLPKIGVYTFGQGKYSLLNWASLDKEIREKDTQGIREMEVFLGKKEKLKCRMVIVPVPQEMASERIRIAEKGGKRKKGYQLSKEYKIKTHYNIYITNVPDNILNTCQVIEAYRLRWQIEIVFKTWKSNLDVHKIKSVKTPRMECQLIIRLIWILINTQIHSVSNALLSQKYPGEGCSIFKFLKYATKFFRKMMECLDNITLLFEWYNSKIAPILKNLKVDKRLEKKTHCEILKGLLEC